MGPPLLSVLLCPPPPAIRRHGLAGQGLHCANFQCNPADLKTNASTLLRPRHRLPDVTYPVQHDGSSVCPCPHLRANGSRVLMSAGRWRCALYEKFSKETACTELNIA